MLQTPAECAGFAVDRIVRGTEGNDVLRGTNQAECILAYGGNDLIYGGGGNDRIFAGNGNDDVRGENGADKIYLGAGDDRAWGGNQADEIFGEQGNDRLYGENQDDLLEGGLGQDVLDGGNGKDLVNGGDGDDRITSDNGKDTVAGGAGADFILTHNAPDRVTGGACHDVIVSGHAPDKVSGDEGYDACDGAACELPEGAHTGCISDNTCGSQKRCVISNGLCVPASAERCEDGAPQEPSDAGMDAGSDAGLDAGLDASTCAPSAVTDTSCDGVDDDCDGATDDDYEEESVSCGVGACRTSGVTECVAAEIVQLCTPLSPAPSDASCDDIDDDCDGSRDEDYMPASTQCGVGACAATGSTSCLGGNVVNSCVPGAPSGTDATCDGIDDDCDGAADEHYAAASSACGQGVCAANGQTYCADGQVFDSCVPGAQTGSDDDCDGVDDDCDGEIDEAYAALVTSCGVGACRATGATQCAAGVVVDSCEPGLAAASDATCDGIDNNCNGTTDEAYASTPTSCGVGACRTNGQTSCVAGAVLDSCTPGASAASDSTCDAVDDDCDGAQDEDYAAVVTHCGTGSCASDGATSCVAGAVVDSCAAGSAAANDETCDGLDNDCDGESDEDYAPEPTTCGIGACVGDGQTSCEDGVVHDSCEPGEEDEDDATCDGVDDDCDGEIDEDYVALVTHCGLGACRATGVTSCVSGDELDSCTAGQAGGADSSCNGVDDDCDGGIDEEFVARSTQCGLGVCAATGLETCEFGALVNSCVPFAAQGPSDASCDGLDNDCDGASDEEYAGQTTTCGIGACGATGATSCVAGTLVDSCQPAEDGATDVSCNGVDDDCDGAQDEDYAPVSTSCGIGACAASGATSCVAGNVIDSCHSGTAAASDVSCDGIDDDCDGFSDEDYGSAPTSCGVGACGSTGSTSCVAGQVVNSCQPGPAADLDTSCDGVDDDCNGANDEDFVGQATSCGVGACAASGQTSCVAGHVTDSCAATLPSASDTTCDGIDDDCNAQIDEDYQPVASSCGVGACAATGTTACVAGHVSDLCEPGAPAADDSLCDGIDDDCNGQIDEDYAAVATTCGVGTCAATGLTSCVAGAEQDSCTPHAPAASDSTCDGIDDDCSGEADEDYVSTETSCGVGACGAVGRTSCDAGVVRDSCAPSLPALNDATCNGVDDDCDGTRDEDYVSTSTSCGVGACAAQGTTSCFEGSVTDSCEAGAPAANDASCNARDDDCDGAADEDYASTQTSCGVGACASTGATSCVAGSLVDSCQAGTAAASDASCDGVDNDCDGASDEDYAPQTTSCGVGACGATGTTSCLGGAVVDSCTSGDPAANDATCDGVDDDCDGVSDEDYAPEPTHCGVGACAATGSTSCVAGRIADSCTDGPSGGPDSDCDGIDDDCDGIADDEFTPAQTSCGTGACSNSGTTSCVDGTLEDSCVPFGAAATDATCDGTDNDCDGVTDEDYVVVSTTCGVGACAASGTLSCSAGVETNSCTPAAPALFDATCDAIDNDCDGSADEDYVGIVTSCGLGACRANGLSACVNGVVIDQCAAGPQTGMDEDCDGIDQNCDGTADDGYVSESSTCGLGVCAASGSTSCIAGDVIASCTPLAPTGDDVDCDGSDQDCDGSADDGYVPVATTCGLGVCLAAGLTSCEDGVVAAGACTPQAATGNDFNCDGLDDDCDGQVDEDALSTGSTCVRAQIDVPSRYNPALLNAGATLVSPTTATGAVDGALNTTFFANTVPVVITVRLANGSQVIDAFTFKTGNVNMIGGTVELWVSDKPTFDATSFTFAGTNTVRDQFTLQIFPIAPVRATYVQFRSVTGPGQGPGQQIGQVGVLTPARGGGITTLGEGGATVVNTATDDFAHPPSHALDYSAATYWNAAAGRELIVQLNPPDQQVRFVDVLSTPPSTTNLLHGFDVYTSSTGTATTDFTRHLALGYSGTTTRTEFTRYFLPRTTARYLKFVPKSGSPNPQVNQVRLFSDRFGSPFVPFSDLTVVPSGATMTSWLWDFGDGQTSTEQHPRHRYALAGSYVISLRATDSAGRRYFDTITYRALTSPIPTYTTSPAVPTEANGPAVTLFGNVQTASGTSVIDRVWSMQPSPTAMFNPPLNGSNPQISYTDSGDYFVTLQVTDTQLITESYARAVHVQNVPQQVNAGPNVTGPWGVPTWLWQTSYVEPGSYDRQKTLCQWNWGDGSSLQTITCADTRAKHAWANPGSYTATLVTTDPDGNVVSDTASVTVITHPTEVVLRSTQQGTAPGDMSLTFFVGDLAMNHRAVTSGNLRVSVPGQTVTVPVSSTGNATVPLTFTSGSEVTVTAEYLGNTFYEPSSFSDVLFAPEDGDAPELITPQQFGYEGNRFVVAFPQNAYNTVGGSLSVTGLIRNAVALKLTSRAATTARVRTPFNNMDETVSVKPGVATTIFFPDEIRLGAIDRSIWDRPLSGVIQDRGIEVTSDEPIAIHAINQVVASADGYLGLPMSMAGTDYTLVAYPNENSYYYPELGGTLGAIVAAEDNTIVTITPADDITAGPQLVNGATKGVPFTITLNALQAFQFANNDEAGRAVWEDLSGTLIHANKRISVFGGHSAGTVLGAAADYMIEQIPTDSQLGTNFPILTFWSGVEIQARGYDVGTVVATADDTHVSIDGVLKVILNRGERYWFSVPLMSSALVTTSKPAHVTQNMTGASTDKYGVEFGDPSMAIVVPSDQYVPYTHFATPPCEAEYDNTPDRQDVSDYEDFVNIIAPIDETAGVLLDGAPIDNVRNLNAGWLRIADSGFAGIRLQVECGAHTVSHVHPDVKLGVMSYGGLLSFESYAYPAAMDRRATTCQLSDPEAGDKVDNDCDGRADEELDDGVDNDGDGRVDEDTAQSLPPANVAPVAYDQTFRRLGGTPTNIVLSASDANRDALTYHIVQQPTTGVVTVSGNVATCSLLDWVTTFSFRAFDGQLYSNTATVRITTAPPGGACGATCNHPPLISAPIGGLRYVPGKEFVYKFETFDVDRDPFTISLLSAPPGMTVDQNGYVRWLVPSSQSATVYVTLRATDPTGDSGDLTQALQRATSNGPPFSSVPATTASVYRSYEYVAFASSATSYRLLAGPPGMQMHEGRVTYVPDEAATGQYQVVIGAWNSLGEGSTQTYTLTVLGSDLTFSNSPQTLSQIGRLYSYTPFVTDGDPSGGALTYSLEYGPVGMTIDAPSGRVEWLPESDEFSPGAYPVSIRVQNQAGDVSRQVYGIELTQEDTRPHIRSTPERSAIVGAPYVYDVEAYDYDGRRVLTYSLDNGPSDMDIDPVTGLIQWLPSALGSYQVTVRVTDPFGQHSEQAYALEVVPDSVGPRVTLLVQDAHLLEGESTTISVLASDNVQLSSLLVTVNGQAVTLDSEGQATVTAQAPGAITITATATDAGGNTTSVTKRVGVTDPNDTTAPAVEIVQPFDSAQVTFLTDVIGSVSDDNLLSWTLSIGDTADALSDYLVLAEGAEPVTANVLGVIDATRLMNSHYNLRLVAEDVSGNQTIVLLPVRVEGGAKVGLVRLGFLDMTIPAPGFDVQVVRTYDTRQAHKRGDFGYGWDLDLRGPQVRNNRPIGKDFAVWSKLEDFAFPCREQLLQKPHYTEVRISDSEWYVFSPFVANLQAISGGCNGELAFEQVDGSSLGAELFPAGDNLVRPSASYRISGLPPPMDLWRVSTGTLYDENHFQLTTPDGRVLDITIENGLNWVQDANDNTLFLNDNRVQHNEGTTIAFTRDTQNRIKSIQSTDGTSLAYQYNTAGDLRVVKDAEGFETRFDYASSPAHYLTRIIRPDGTDEALFDYDEDGRLVQSCGPESHCIENVHDLNTRTEWFIDGPEQIRYTYDLRGNVVSETNALNETTTYTYAAFDRLETSTSPLGEVTHYTYDRNGNLLSKEEPHEADEAASDFTTTYTYDSKNRRTSMTMPSGGSFAWTYDDHGNELTVRDGTGATIRSLGRGPGGRVISETTRFGTTTYNYLLGSTLLAQPRSMRDPKAVLHQYEYDGMGRLTEVGEDLGYRRRMTYDRNGRMTFQHFGGGITVAYGYRDEKANWTSIEGPTFGRVTREFTDDGKLARVIEPNGDSRQYLYDARRRLEREIDEVGAVTQYVRDLAGRVTEVQELGTGAVTRFAHDAAGRVTSRTDALNHTTTMSYKAGGRLESMTDARDHTRTFSDTPETRTVVDALNRTTVRQLSDYGLTLGTSLPGGTSTSISYAGNTRIDESQRFPLGVTDEGSRPRSYGYDADGGMTSATDLGGANAWQYTYGYAKSAQLVWDAESGQVSVGPSDARASAYEFSSSGGSAYGDVPSLSSDSNFTYELRTVTTPSGDVTRFNRDSQGRMAEVILPWGARKTYLYNGPDGDTQPENTLLPQGTVLTHTYDANHREVKRTSDAGESRSFSYTEGDRLASMTDATGTTYYEYDAVGRFAGIVYPHGGSVRYQRDKLGRTVRQEVRATNASAPQITRYEYDPIGNLAKVIDPLNGETTFLYDAENRLTSRTLPNGVVTTYTYDDRDRPLSVVHKNAQDIVLAARHYVRAPGGEPTKITNEDGSYVEVGYDAALRITSEKYFDVDGELEEEIGYGYDADGNRVSKTRNGTPDVYSYLAGARITAAGTSSYGNDTAGRVTSMNRADGTFTLVYDSDEHVTSVTKNGVETAFGFDAMGRRTRVSEGGTEKRYLVAPNMGASFESPQMVTDASGAPVASFVFAGEHPIMKIVDGQPQYYLADSMGSVIGFADATGTALGTLEYDGFGNPRGGDALSAEVAGDFRFQGMWKDPSGLYYVRARTYEAETGRFTSRDPAEGKLQRPESFYAYAFANNTPAVWRDPTGLFTVGQVTMATSISISLATTAISKWSALVRGEISAQQYGMMLGAAAFTGTIGALGGGGSLAASIAKGALAGGSSAGLQNYLEQKIDGRKRVDAFSVTISTLGGTFIGGFGSLLGRTLAAQGFAVEHSTGLYPFGAEASQEIRVWSEMLYSPAELVFDKGLASLTELLEAVMQEVVNSAHEPHAGSK